MMPPHRRYIIINSVSGFLYFFVLISPFYAADRGISISSASWIFSFVYAVQAILSYTVGRIFERFPPGVGIMMGRAIYSVGPLILAFRSGVEWFIAAQIAASFFDVFFPSVVLYERAIAPPEEREAFYRDMITLSESVKIAFLVFFAYAYLNGMDVYKAIFLSLFFASIGFIVAFKLFLPSVSSGREGASEKWDKKSLFYLYLSQLFVFSSFNFASWMIVSYYLYEVLGGRNVDIVYFEFFLSVPIVLMYPILRKYSRKLSLRAKFFLGSLIMSGYFFTIPLGNLTAFFLSHVFLGIGFPIWLPAKETIKFRDAPAELGRWEGFFQGANIFGRIVFPPLSALIARSVSYNAVFLAAGILAVVGSLFALGVRD